MSVFAVLNRRREQKKTPFRAAFFCVDKFFFPSLAEINEFLHYLRQKFTDLNCTDLIHFHD